MFCVECGKEIPDAAKFCPDCGTPQAPASEPTKTKNIEEAEQELPFAEIESIEEQELPFTEIEKSRKERKRYILFGIGHCFACYLFAGLIGWAERGDAPFFLIGLLVIVFFMMVFLFCHAGYRVIKVTYQIWKESFSKWYNKTSNYETVKGANSVNVLMESKSYNMPNWAVLLVPIMLIGFILLLSGEDDSNSDIANNDYTTIDVQLYNNDDARHPVHVYLDGERVYAEWVEAGEMAWPTICRHRCPDGEYTVAVDWGGDAEYECTYYVKISYEGDRETVSCNYN